MRHQARLHIVQGQRDVISVAMVSVEAALHCGFIFILLIPVLFVYSLFLRHFL
jgi:hypothetical protein